MIIDHQNNFQIFIPNITSVNVMTIDHHGFNRCRHHTQSQQDFNDAHAAFADIQQLLPHLAVGNQMTFTSQLRTYNHKQIR